MIDRRRALIEVVIAGALLAAGGGARAADSQTPAIQASFQPPIDDDSTERTYAFATGALVLAGPITAYGPVLGAGRPFGSSERPRASIELGLGIMHGAGDFGTASGLESAGDLRAGMLVSAVSAMFKLRVLDEQRTRWLRLTLYGGPSVGLTDVGLENEHGTAHRRYATGALVAGAVARVFPVRYVEIMLYGGGRGFGMVEIPEAGDKDTLATGMLAPEYGGNLVAHLPRGLDLSLGALMSFLERDGGRESARVFMLGLGWTPQGGLAPVTEVEP